MISRETEGLHHELDDKPEYNLKDLLPKRRKPPNKSDIYYIEVIHDVFFKGPSFIDEILRSVVTCVHNLESV